MAIANYSDLQTSISNWLHRSDLSSMITDFITLAESKLSTDLDCYWQIARATCSTTAADQYITIPDDVVNIKELLLTNGDTVTPLVTQSLTTLSTYYQISTPDVPKYYAVLGNQLKLGPIPADVYQLELIYKQRIPALSNVNTTNWLITNYPDAYLWASLLSAQPYIMNDGRLASISQLYTNSVNAINRAMFNPVVPEGGIRMRAV